MDLVRARELLASVAVVLLVLVLFVRLCTTSGLPNPCSEISNGFSRGTLRVFLEEALVVEDGLDGILFDRVDFLEKAGLAGAIVEAVEFFGVDGS